MRKLDTLSMTLTAWVRRIGREDVPSFSREALESAMREGFTRRLSRVYLGEVSGVKCYLEMSVTVNA